MIGEKLRAAVGMIAPKLGAALGGPAGALAGEFIARAVGTTDEAAGVAELTQPDKITALREAEQRFELAMRQAELTEQQTDAGDRASARDMAIHTTQTPQIMLSALFVCGYLGVLGLFFAQWLRVPMGEAFMVMLGALTAAVTQIINFWFGSSHGSASSRDALIGLAQRGRP